MSESPSVLESVAIAHLRRGDVLVFRCPEKLSEKRRADAAAVLEETFGDVPTLILDGGQSLDIVRPEPTRTFWQRIFGRHDGG